MSTQENNIWYYATAAGEKVGPITLAELSKQIEMGVITEKTLVWNPDYTEWIEAGKMMELLISFNPSATEPNLHSEDSQANLTSPLPLKELKPHKLAFLLPKLVITFVLCCMVGLLLSIVFYGMELSPWLGLFIALAGMAFGVFICLIIYRKERYQLQAHRLVYYEGGLFSDEANELDIRNITHVKITLPWLRYKFLKVGDVIVKTAGTTRPRVMRSIHDPKSIYAEMRERMKSNGYDLTQRQLLHKEKPALIAVVLECAAILAIVAFFTISFLSRSLTELNASEANMAMTTLGIILAGVTVFAALRFLDLRRRTYSVFNDVVVYEEGFLTQHNAFIPYENISDSNFKQTFIDQILGLYDVQISCQGSDSEIKFRRLKDGINLSASIDQLVLLASKKQKLSKQTIKDSSENSAKKRPRRVEPQYVPLEDIPMSEFRIHAARALVPILFFIPLFPLWIIATFQSLIQITSTRFYIRSGSLRHSYKFLSVEEREFTFDKITGLVIKRNPWDKFFGTMTLKFWSIGSGKPMVFAHIKSDLINLPTLMHQLGIPPVTAEAYHANASFSSFTCLRAHILTSFIFALFIAADIATSYLIKEPWGYALLIPTPLIIIGCLIYAKFYYACQRLRFNEHHIEAEQGIFARSTYYVRYKNVKRISATRYPGGEEGELKIYVAGEEEINTQVISTKKSLVTPMLKQCSFTSGMLSQAWESGRLLDDILSGRVDSSVDATPAAPAEVLAESRRSVGNALATLMIISIVFFPSILLLPITIPVIIVWAKRWRYCIEDFRILTSHGIFFRSKTSVLLDRVDSLKKSQGFLNKIFNNGKVTIMTAGSSKPDLFILDAPDFTKLHDIIRDNLD